MKYDKPPLSIGEQAALLKKRGMLGDSSLIVARLKAVSYYRLSGYWYPFRQGNPTSMHQPLDEKFQRLTATFDGQAQASARLEKEIHRSGKGIDREK